MDIDISQQRDNSQIEQLQRELERRSNDRVQVFNPTDKDFTVVWNNFNHRVPASENAILPRYVAEKYVKEIVNHLINQENEERVVKENKHRVSSGQKEMDPQERLVFDLRTNNPELRKKYVTVVYKGIVEEYGKDLPIPEDTPQTVMPSDADLLSEIDSAVPATPKPKTKAKADAKIKKQLEERIKDGSSN